MRSSASKESAVLFVRSVSEMGAALAAVEHILALRVGRDPQTRVELHGVWVDPRLEEGLASAVLWGTDEPRSSGSVAVGDCKERVSILIRDSISLAGVWTLCPIDGPPLRAAPDAVARQRVVLDTMAVASRAMVPRQPAAGQFFPIFPATMSAAGTRAAFWALRSRQPGVVAPKCLLVVNERGLPRFRSGGAVPRVRPRGSLVLP